MTLRFVAGDLLLSSAQTLAHGVNCRGRMGAGIAVAFKSGYPEMFREYRRRCRSGELHPGGYYLWKGPDRWILNLATQDEIGGARIEFVRQTLQALADCYVAEGITSVAMPRIAAGLGGLSWEEVKVIIEHILGRIALPVFVYEDYVEGARAVEE